MKNENSNHSSESVCNLHDNIKVIELSNEISMDNLNENNMESQNRNNRKIFFMKKNSARFIFDINEAEDFIFSSGISCSVLNRIENSLSRL